MALFFVSQKKMTGLGQPSFSSGLFLSFKDSRIDELWSNCSASVSRQLYTDFEMLHNLEVMAALSVTIHACIQTQTLPFLSINVARGQS